MNLSFQPLWPVTMVVVCCCWGFIAFRDWRTMRIRTRDVLLVFAVLASMIAVQSIVQESMQGFLALLGAAGYYLLFRLVYFSGQLGGGDVRLAALLGLVHGWYGFPHVVLALLLIVAIPAIWGIVLKVWQKKSTFPYAPGMCLGSVAGMIIL
ncbi:MAG: A24 family peptidase [Micrococcaceae bacterium]